MSIPDPRPPKEPPPEPLKSSLAELLKAAIEKKQPKESK